MAHSTYTPDLAAEICKRIALGDSLRTICDLDSMPDQTTVYRWLREREDFRQQYARAREDQAEHYLDEIITISDDSSRDTIHGEDRDMPNSEWIARSRLRVDARKWAMSKLAPKKYGDKLDLTSAGESLNLTPEQRQSKMAAIAAAAAKRRAEDDGSDLV
ncbi:MULTISPECIES: terminase small subunit protein [unclassified Caballeronia]|uniref:terminase small subunit-like protein n=1 Tax=unclassified Caballeronia TaxID=2646786 RepID=UPI00286063C6|nr:MULTISPECIES: terminase small subunit protein [unclassified Caballeronia]MDR5772092.1 terminase small subunit protein [Caballeronia sp. LZ002]MDR5847526.1 terminase small subunit protein [Caballeronia sp. LZ003]